MSITTKQLEYLCVTAQNWGKSPIARFAKAFFVPDKPLREPRESVKKRWDKRQKRVDELRKMLDKELGEQHQLIQAESERMWDVQPGDAVLIRRKGGDIDLVTVKNVIPDQINPLLIRPLIEFTWYGKDPYSSNAPAGSSRIWMPLCHQFNKSLAIRQAQKTRAHAEWVELLERVKTKGDPDLIEKAKRFGNGFFPKTDEEIVWFWNQRANKYDTFQHFKQQIEKEL